MATIRIENVRINTEFIASYELNEWGCISIQLCTGQTHRFDEKTATPLIQKLDQLMLRTKMNMVSVPRVVPFPQEAA